MKKVVVYHPGLDRENEVTPGQARVMAKSGWVSRETQEESDEDSQILEEEVYSNELEPDDQED